MAAGGAECEPVEGVPEPEVLCWVGFGAECTPPGPEAWCGVEGAGVDDTGVAATTGAAEAVTAGATEVCGVECVVGAAARWCACLPSADGDTTIFAAGGGAVERDPVEGRCTVPESRSRAIAAPPRSSGIKGAATRRAATQTASHLPLSSAGTGLSSPSLDGPPPALTQKYKKPRRTATRT